MDQMMTGQTWKEGGKLDQDGDGADADNLDEQQNAEMQQETAENSAEDDLLSAHETRYACWSARSHDST